MLPLTLQRGPSLACLPAPLSQGWPGSPTLASATLTFSAKGGGKERVCLFGRSALMGGGLAS